MSNRNFTSFPILTTERLTLRQLSTDDQQAIFALRSDAAINKYLLREPSKTLEDAINFINKVNDNIKISYSYYWVISLTNTKTVAGTICLFNFSSETNSCEIGYELLPAFHGKGIMKEAAEKVIEYVFRVLQCKIIVAHTHKENQDSIKLLKKCNFLLSKDVDKENPDFIIFSLTHSDNNIKLL